MKKNIAISLAASTALILTACGTDPETRPTTDDGALIKQIGEWAGANCTDDTIESCNVQFKVDAIETGTGCAGMGYTSAYDDPAEDTTDYVLIRSTIKMTSEADPIDQNFGTNTSWTVVGDDGVSRPLDEEYMCIGDDIDPNDSWAQASASGMTAERTTLYKVPPETGSIQLVDTIGDTRWQWEMP